MGKDAVSHIGREVQPLGDLQRLLVVTKATAEPLLQRSVEGFLTVKCDVTSSEEIDAAFSEIEEQLGAPEVVVANAGVTRDGLSMKMSDDAFTSVLDANLTGAVLPVDGGLGMGH